MQKVNSRTTLNRRRFDPQTYTGYKLEHECSCRLLGGTRIMVTRWHGVKWTRKAASKLTGKIRVVEASEEYQLRMDLLLSVA